MLDGFQRFDANAYMMMSPNMWAVCPERFGGAPAARGAHFRRERARLLEHRLVRGWPIGAIVWPRRSVCQYSGDGAR